MTARAGKPQIMRSGPAGFRGGSPRTVTGRVDRATKEPT
jgi:hypothetical protein